jgi:hypothetical protein
VLVTKKNLNYKITQLCRWETLDRHIWKHVLDGLKERGGFWCGFVNKEGNRGEEKL